MINTRFKAILAILTFLTLVLLEPLFAVYFLDSNNWKVIVLVKVIVNILCIILFFKILKRSWETSSKKDIKEFIKVLILFLMPIYLIFGAYNGFMDLITGEREYSGECVVHRGHTRFIDYYDITLVNTDMKKKITSNHPTYFGYQGDFAWGYSGYTCTKVVNVKYLEHLNVMLDIEDKDKI